MTKPPVTNTNHILPFGELSSAQFERLCLWLVEREGYLRPQHLGEAGSEQGRDVIAYRAIDRDEQLWYFQCKRYQTLGAPKLIEEIEKYNKLVKADASKKPFGIVFVTNATLSSAAREKVGAFCAGYGYQPEFWARTELDMLVKKHTDVVSEFFDLAPDAVTHVQSKRTGDVNILGDARGVTINIGADNASGAQLSKPPLPRDRISIARLPTSGRDLFGRGHELQLLDEAWDNPNINIVTFIAWGGVGKTALVNHWLKRRMALDNYRGAERVYAWSFYSQGTSERAASADLFIDQALRWFGDTDPTAGSPWDKGERLAGYIRQTRTLLILDGLEPLQHPPGPQEGRLKDPALQAMLVELAAQQPGVCVISTRERVGDLVEFENGTVVQHNLEHLSPEAGAQILRSLSVKGDEDELEQAAKEYEGHALALNLLGSYLGDVCGGDIRRRNEIESLEEDVRLGRHAEKVMRAYEKWLGEGMEVAILRLLGLFDRPADIDSVVALREPPVIVGLTEPLQHFKGREWNQAVAKLRRIKLLGEASSNEPGTLDAHPLVREHFKQQLKRERPDAWREGNKRLYDHLRDTTKEFPNTIEEMMPLYAAVAHGCAAGRYKEALKVLRTRIMRGDQFFSYNLLGAFGTELAALSGFFQTCWEVPVNSVSDIARASLIGTAAGCLRALGRLREATQPMQTSLARMIALEHWGLAVYAAAALSHLLGIIGDLQYSKRLAEQTVEIAERSKNRFDIMFARTHLARALHQEGRTEEARILFQAIERMQVPQVKERMSIYPYCDFLLEFDEFQIVKEQATKAVKTSEVTGHLLLWGLESLLIGRSHVIEAKKTGNAVSSEAQAIFQKAVEKLRLARQADWLPVGLLARSDFHRFNQNYNLAERDLDEVVRIASRSGMNLHLADYHLESARLRLAQGDKEEAREHLTTAKGMIERMGYRRRDKELGEIELQLGPAQNRSPYGRSSAQKKPD